MGRERKRGRESGISSIIWRVVIFFFFFRFVFWTYGAQGSPLAQRHQCQG